MDPKRLLRENKLSHTSHRIKLLSVLSEAGRAMTEKEIEEKMHGCCNKTTVYRNLSSLVEKKIVHRIISGEAVRFSLKLNKGEHVHFQCRKCNTIYCMEEIPVQDYKLPEGFRKIENNFLIMGICRKCR